MQCFLSPVRNHTHMKFDMGILWLLWIIKNLTNHRSFLILNIIIFSFHILTFQLAFSLSYFRSSFNEKLYMLVSDVSLIGLIHIPERYVLPFISLITMMGSCCVCTWIRTIFYKLYIFGEGFFTPSSIWMAHPKVTWCPTFTTAHGTPPFPLYHLGMFFPCM